jgi:tRNA(fMet)-specific endonuclease VapC
MSGGLVLLDTSIIIHLIRGNAVGVKIDRDYQLRKSLLRPLISVISIGECLALADQFKWGESKTARLLELLREFVPVNITAQPVLDSYKRIAAHLRAAGRPIGQNDIWIAACAGAASATLLTTDRDFDAIPAELLAHVWIDPHIA